MSEIKVNLQVQGVSGYNSGPDDEFPQTARLWDEEERSSDSSAGRDTKSLEKGESFNVIDVLNRRLVQRMGQVDPNVLNFIAHNNARKI